MWLEGIDHRSALAPAATLLGVSQAVQASSDYGPALWSPAASSNYTVGREGSPVQYVVIHTMQGSYAGSISWFRNPSARVSAGIGGFGAEAGSMSVMLRPFDERVVTAPSRCVLRL